MDYIEMLNDFTEKHPVWTWVLARFVIAACVCTLVGVGLIALVVAFAPLLTAGESDSVGFAVWLWLPVLGTIIWLLCSVIEKVYDAFISEW